MEEEAGLLLQLSLVVQEEASLPSFELRLLVGEAELSPEAVVVEAGVVQMQVAVVDQDKYIDDDSFLS